MAEPRRLVVSKDMVGNLTVGELELLEEKTGRPLSKLFDENAPRGVLLHCLAYITMRREDPAVTWEDVADVVPQLVDPDAPEEVATTADPTVGGRARRRG